CIWVGVGKRGKTTATDAPESNFLFLEDKSRVGSTELLCLFAWRTGFHSRERGAIQAAGGVLVTIGRHATEQPRCHSIDRTRSVRSCSNRSQFSGCDAGPERPDRGIEPGSRNRKF